MLGEYLTEAIEFKQVNLHEYLKEKVQIFDEVIVKQQPIAISKHGKYMDAKI